MSSRTCHVQASELLTHDHSEFCILNSEFLKAYQKYQCADAANVVPPTERPNPPPVTGSLDE
jgi:hypothetical protein